MSATVLAIYIARSPGQPMAELATASFHVGKGIEGDRYFDGTGTFSEKLKGRPDFEVTLIESEELARFNAEHLLALGLGDLRRNVITRGVRLNDLVGRQFTVGGVTLEGVRLCEPCAHLATVATPLVLPAMVGRAGLRARVVTAGVVRAGDAIRV